MRVDVDASDGAGCEAEEEEWEEEEGSAACWICRFEGKRKMSVEWTLTESSIMMLFQASRNSTKIGSNTMTTGSAVGDDEDCTSGGW